MPLRLADMPAWPAMLSREQAAAYVGVSVETFEAEIAKGWWPDGTPRGAKGGKLTWSRAALDRRIMENLGGASDDGQYGLDEARTAAARRREAEARGER